MYLIKKYTSIMILKISFKERIYLTKVESTKYGYSFRFKEKNGQFDWAHFFYFQKFKCSLKWRLNHYKDFKRRVTGETVLGCRNTVLLDNYFFENNLVTSVS